MDSPIKPSNGRIVLIQSNVYDYRDFPAIVTAVSDDGSTINVTVFPTNGGGALGSNLPLPLQNLPYFQDDLPPEGDPDTTPAIAWRWMPYQLATAQPQAEAEDDDSVDPYAMVDELDFQRTASLRAINVAAAIHTTRITSGTANQGPHHAAELIDLATKIREFLVSTHATE